MIPQPIPYCNGYIHTMCAALYLKGELIVHYKGTAPYNCRPCRHVGQDLFTVKLIISGRIFYQFSNSLIPNSNTKFLVKLGMHFFIQKIYQFSSFYF